MDDHYPSLEVISLLNFHASWDTRLLTTPVSLRSIDIDWTEGWRPNRPPLRPPLREVLAILQRHSRLERLVLDQNLPMVDDALGDLPQVSLPNLRFLRIHDHLPVTHAFFTHLQLPESCRVEIKVLETAHFRLDAITLASLTQAVLSRARGVQQPRIAMDLDEATKIVCCSESCTDEPEVSLTWPRARDAQDQRILHDFSPLGSAFGKIPATKLVVSIGAKAPRIGPDFWRRIAGELSSVATVHLNMRGRLPSSFVQVLAPSEKGTKRLLPNMRTLIVGGVSIGKFKAESDTRTVDLLLSGLKLRTSDGIFKTLCMADGLQKTDEWIRAGVEKAMPITVWGLRNLEEEPGSTR
ncbi:hypothetical protein PUNSTDRAFT_138924 [Punctularia strigosozonata HHB-11173 SS5]|uniref:F-box domain-containing protein n=1 Tax=Punctularia strigosozonata (strain HHB-11173) TaxID=741275 RepID=R7S1V4_PUNST|nr:uncharacterized protein PUNSTDRAFT_138924 [Punctularia strigosozonata HHB-11173 SS5]EIN04198.1 hypothetical protein PUNSTDRAFT_138924 [Punctularia strigosozonata HHB-11173 SS5]